LLAVVPQPNENAWLLGLAALRQQQHVGLVGARGLEPATFGATNRWPIASTTASTDPCRDPPRPAAGRPETAVCEGSLAGEEGFEPSIP